VAWTTAAEHDLHQLSREDVERVLAAVKRLAETEQGDVKRLQNVRPPEWRLRVGAWRVRFYFDDKENTIVVLHVFHRREAYR
jgi:mRNA-degrading endonuclease RelE of RelBE toxin-antitoxin system